MQKKKQIDIGATVITLFNRIGKRCTKAEKIKELEEDIKIAKLEKELKKVKT